MISRRERRESEQDDVRLAFAEFLAATYQAVAELQKLPAGKPPTPVGRMIDRFQPDSTTWIREQRMIKETGGRVWIVGDRMTLAWARLQVLPVPTGALDAAEEAAEYVERLGLDRSDSALRMWPDIHDRLERAAQDLAEAK